MMDHPWITLAVLANYVLVPIAVVLLCLELYATKRRAARYEKALGNIADQAREGGAEGTRRQRDAMLTEARLALYQPSDQVIDHAR